jgi:glutathione peroxidase
LFLPCGPSLLSPWPDNKKVAGSTSPLDLAAVMIASRFSQDLRDRPFGKLLSGRPTLDAVQTLSDFTAQAINGQDRALAEYAGKVVLVVNTASHCGFTPQYDGLEALFKEYRNQGLVVLGFPCDQFGGQEPGDEAEIDEFCKLNFGVTFPMFAKIEVNGSEAHPLYQWLRQEKSGVLGDAIKWNFTKFLVGRNGTVINRYAPSTAPEKIAPDIAAALAA